MFVHVLCEWPSYPFYSKNKISKIKNYYNLLQTENPNSPLSVAGRTGFNGWDHFLSESQNHAHGSLSVNWFASKLSGSKSIAKFLRQEAFIGVDLRRMFYVTGIFRPSDTVYVSPNLFFLDYSGVVVSPSAGKVTCCLCRRPPLTFEEKKGSNRKPTMFVLTKGSDTHTSF